MRLIYHPAAEGELVAAAQFYERKVAALGREFQAAVERAVDDICQDPLRWNVIEDGVRRYLMKRFPYAILYQVLGDGVYILACKHHSRNPDYWRERLSN